MAKVELVTESTAPLLVRSLFAAGDPGPITAALANVPELAASSLDFINAVYGPTSLPARLKEIVVLRVSAANRCNYCVETHSGVARRMGFQAAEVSALRGDSDLPAPAWAERELAALRFSDAISNHPDTAVECLRQLFSDAEIVELTLVAATTILLNRFATALELPV